MRLAAEPGAKPKPPVPGGSRPPIGGGSRPPVPGGSRPPQLGSTPPVPPPPPPRSSAPGFPPPVTPPPAPVAAVPPPPAPTAPRPSSGLGKKIGIGLGVVALAGAAVAAFFYLRENGSTPSASAVRAQVESLIGTAQLKVNSVTPTITPVTPGNATVTYEAEAAVRETLYEPVDAAAILRDELKLDATAWQRARKTLAGKTAPRILELAGAKGVDQTLLLTTFLRESTPRGAKLTFSGSLRATKSDRGWQLTSEQLTRTGGEERGKPRSAYGTYTTVVADKAAMEKLRTLAAAQADLPAKVEVGREAFLKEREAEQEKIIAQLLDTLKAGTVYAGTAKAGSDAPNKIYLEFTAVNSASKKVTAVLRNDGGWSDQRACSGTFVFDPEEETLAVNLESPGRNALPQSGPVLSDPDTLRFAFQLNGNRLVSHDPRREVELTRLSPAELADTQKQVDGPALALREATDAGKVYRGTVKGRDGAPLDYILRFNQQDSVAGTVVAAIEPTGRESWRRTYRGTLATSRYRPQASPLLFETKASEAVASADEHTPLGLRRDATIGLQLASGHLRGTADDFTYDFSPLTEADVAKLEAAAAEREKGQLAIVKAGIAYPGTAVSESKGVTEKVRLRFRSVDPHGASVDAVVESLERPGISREFIGSLDTFERRLGLTTTNKGRASAGSRAGLKFPAFVLSGEVALQLTLTNSALEGEVPTKGWKVSFPLSGATEVSADAAGDYPTESGAYVWTDRAWRALPRNGFKISKGALNVLGGLFSSFTKSSSNSNEKVAELTFSGSDTPPVISGQGAMIVYVGSMHSDRAQKSSYPEMELAATSRDSDGTRRVNLYKIASSSTGGFREHRVMAVVERVNDTVLELTPTHPLPPGSYAIMVNDEAFELTVE